MFYSQEDGVLLFVGGLVCGIALTAIGLGIVALLIV